MRLVEGRCDFQPGNKTWLGSRMATARYFSKNKWLVSGFIVVSFVTVAGGSQAYLTLLCRDAVPALGDQRQHF